MPLATYIRLRETRGVLFRENPEHRFPLFGLPRESRESKETMKSAGKVKSLEEIEKIVGAARRQGKVVITTNGCFDLIHPGHVEMLEWAKAKGDTLIVGIDADASVRKNKGPGRPIVPAKDRARVLAGLAAVDYVFVFRTENPIPWLMRLKPKIHVKGRGSERDPRFAPEERVVVAGGGRVLLAPKIKGPSTTSIVQKASRRYGGKKNG
jgi:rfaE bifunctional protein nucleotidyltransferase chain/domain